MGKKLHYLPLLLVFSIFVFLFWTVLRSLGSWVIIEEQMPEKVDVICTFLGHINRITYSKEIARQHPDALWIINSKSNIAFRNELFEEGFDTTRIILIQSFKGTRSEMIRFNEVISQKMEHTQLIHCAVISDLYHMRRITILAHKFFSKPVQIYCVPVPLNSIKDHSPHYTDWWKYRSLRLNVPLELVKIIAAFFY